MSKLRTVALRTVVVVALVLGVLVAAGPVRAADAPPAPPLGLTPSGVTVAGTPALSWSRAADATSYDVQVARTASGFGSLLVNDNTTNRQYVPTRVLPDGGVSWRVRAVGAGGSSDWTTTTFQLDPYGAPTVTGPADLATFAQPDQVPTFSWESVRAAQGYTIRISTDRQFVDPALITTYSTAQTSFVPTSLDVANTYYWQVRADLAEGISSSWSDPLAYKILGPTIPKGWTRTEPATNPDSDVAFPEVQDAVLDWPPVPGADHYDLQVSTDQNFGTLTLDVGNIVSSRYARPQTIGNDQYYWRVRPVDSAGHTVGWGLAPIWRFKRKWPQQPQLEYPDHNATVGDPLFFQWTGVKHASRYALQISTTSTFDPANTVRTCETRHTTLVPGGGTECWPVAAGTYYWRVVGYDDYANDSPRTDLTVGAATIRRFTYLPQSVQLLTPSVGATTDLPTVTWAPLTLAARYQVTITNAATGDIAARSTTAALSFTPRVKLAAATYRWQVQPISADGRYGAEVVPEGQRRFTVVAAAPPTGSSPEPDPTRGSTTGATFQRFPELRWAAVAGASSYVVRVRRTGTIGWNPIERSDYPATQDYATTFLSPGDYEWYVAADLGGGATVVSATTGTFTIASPSRVVGYRAALTGTSFDAGDSCAAGLPSDCENLRQTPVLRWDPITNAGSYRLYLSYDPELTNLVQDPIPVNSTMWSPTGTLADSQAGSAYFWEVVPCTADGCALPAHAEHAFNKLTLPVVSQTPGVVWTPGLDLATAGVPTLVDDVTLTWRDLLETEQDAGTDLGDTVLTTRPRLEARQYRVQTSTDPLFTTLIDNQEVDQTSFTSYGATYPDGPVYWRVQGVDGSNKPMPWSDVRVFVKRAPVPVVTTAAGDADGLLDSVVPQPGAVVSGVQRFAWNALPFASSYDLEVYKNGDTVPQTANRIRNVNTRQIGYTPTAPLAAGADYTWRVRRVDARGRQGGWSPLIRFTVGAAQLSALGPAPGAAVPPNDALFTWAPEPGAASYLFERRSPSTQAVAETRTTVATSWAPLRAIAGGAWEWRVTAYDSTNQPLGTSAWQSFTVSDRPVATNPVVIDGSGAVGTILTAQPPTWDLPDVTTTYQWYRGSGAIDGATGTAYTVVGSDLGQTLTVRATGRRPGYLDGTSTSAGVVGGSGPALAPDERPSVSGTPQVGRTLTVSPGSWPHQPTFGYQWFRKGKAIGGASGRTYVVAPADAGLALAVVVTATATGYGSGTDYAASPTIAKLASRTAIGLSANPVVGTARSTATVSVTVPGLGSPLGTVTVSVDGKKVKAVKLKDGAGGRLDVLLPRLKPGTHTVKATYAGSPATTGSTKTVKIRARK